MKREYIDYVNDIAGEIKNIEKFIEGMDYPGFSTDLKTSHAVIRSLEVIGEAAGNLPDDVKKNYPDEPWYKIAGIRNKIAHEYFGVDLKIVWKTIKEDLPRLKFTAEKIIKDYEQETIQTES
jgi:uncharacterized protein with HEPN domain